MRPAIYFTAILLLYSMASEAFEAGAAKIDITAPIGTPLSGYGARMGRDSTAVHDPIWSRALYLDDGQTRLFLVSVDLIAIMPELRARVLELASEVVSPENIILTATHTHSAQGATTRNVLVRFVSGRYIPEILEQTARGIVDSMRNAYDKRKRAALGYAAGKHEGLSVNRRYSDGPIDEQVGVILVEDADGDPISIITNFAAHPTSVGGDDLFSFSADFPGFYYLEMEELLGPGCVPIFLNGAQGNQTTGNPEQKSGWGRTESIGRLLAQRAHKISNSITFGNVELRLFHKEARLPLTLLDNLLPEQVFLQALEINDLLISFFPGEACVELALEMRRRAQTYGYGAHFSVGLQNHLMYLVPRHLYPDPTYESSSSFFGPGIADWLYTNFESMMPGNESEDEEENEVVAEPVLNSQGIANGILLDLVGSSHAIGVARGTVFINDIRECYETRVIEPVDNGSALPATGMFSYIPSFIETKTLALPVLGMGSRSLLQGISLDLIQEMEGMAEGAHLPFDAFWLLQNAPLYGMIEDKSVLFAAPLCTMFAVVGDRPGAKKLLVGRNLDWALPEKAVITRVHPEKGHAFIQAGFSWNTGVFTAMNDEGLTVCVERVQTKEVMRPEKAPVEFLLRDIVQYADGYEEALERLRRSSYISGVHVLVAGFVDGEPRAAVVEFGEKIIVREEEDGLLLGVMPDNVVTDESGRSRYAKVAAYLEEIPLVGVQEIQIALTHIDDVNTDSSDMSNIWNEKTRHSVVFIPELHSIEIALPRIDGTPGDFLTIPLSGETTYE